MNDRTLEALSTAGLSTTPLGTLEQPGGRSTFFALYDAELAYLDAGRAHRVPLREVTRIHSDREGTLRVETSERTAVTASLLGYDPGRVQAFFQQVRDVTARAKSLPVVPLPAPKTAPAMPTSSPDGGLPSGAAMPGLSAYTPAPTTPVQMPPMSSTANTGGTGLTSKTTVAPTGTQPQPSVQPSIIQPPAAPPPTSTPPSMPPRDPLAARPSTTPGRSEQSRPEISKSELPLGEGFASPLPASSVSASPVPARPEPVVISSMPPVSELPAARPAPRVPAAAAEPAAPTLPGAHTQGPLVSAAAAPASAGGGELTRRAEGVMAFARTVALLAVVLGLAALALGYFQWQRGAPISALWTVLVGGVGTVALLAFAEALRLLAALARARQA